MSQGWLGGSQQSVAASPPATSSFLDVSGGGSDLAVGSLVEYNSASQSAWIPAKVLARNADGTFDLDCKPGVPRSKVRPLSHRPVSTTNLSNSIGSGGVALPGQQDFDVGTKVEYYSASQGGWILARVESYNPASGTYNLDCKPNVTADKIRWPAGLGSQERPSDAGQLLPIRETDESLASNLSLRDHRDAQQLASSAASLSPVPRPVAPALPLGAPASGSTIGAAGSRPPTGNFGGSAPPTATFGGGSFGGGSLGSGALGGSRLAAPPRGAAPGSGRLGSGSVGSAGRATPPRGTPLQLVRVIRSGAAWRFEVNEEAVAALESYGQKPLAVCTVCGPYRTGKSYLLNLLLGRIQRGSQQFRVGSSVNACTEGVWMWGAREESADGSNLVFLDCEGFGSTEADKTRDAKLMALCILMSSVFLLNTKGVLSEGLFNSLSLVCNLAQHVEESGQEASKPALMWLLRDFVLDLKDEAGYDITSDQYLETALRAAPQGNLGSRAAGAKDVRNCLMRFFPERRCSTLVMPVVDEDQLRRLTDLPYETLRPEFRRGVEGLQAQVTGMARARPKTIGGNVVGASGLAALLRRLVEALNSNQTLNIANAWELVQHNACEALSTELRGEAATMLRQVREGGALPVPGGKPLPVPDEVLSEALKEGRRALRAEWRHRAMGDESVRQEYWRELKKSIVDEERLLHQLNGKLAEDGLREAGAAWEAWLMQEQEAVAGDPRSEALSLLLDDGLPTRPTARAVREALSLCRMARVRWDGEKHAQQVQMRLLKSELESQTQTAKSASKLDEATVEQTREMGKFKGQVDALNEQIREAIEREKGLREQVLEAEETARREQQAHNAGKRMNSELTQQVQDLEAQVERLTCDLRDAEGLAEERAARSDAGAKPRCGCTVM